MSGRRAARVAAVAAVLLVAAAAPPVGAQESSQDTGARIQLLEQTFWATIGGRFQMTWQVTDAPPDASVEVDIGIPVRSRSTLRDQLGDEPLPGGVIWRQSDLPAGNGQAVTVDFDVASSPAEVGNRPLLVLNLEGVYPTSLVLRDGTGAVLDRLDTFVVRVPLEPVDSPELQVSVVLVASEVPDAATQDVVQALIRTLEAQPGLDFTVSVDPHLVDALRLEEDVDLLTRLQQSLADRHLLNSTYVSLDEGAWAAAGLGLEVGWQLEEGRTAFIRGLQLTPDSTTMLLSETVSPDLLQRLAVNHGVQLVVVQAGLLPASADPIETPLVRLPTSTSFMEALIVDQTVSEHFRASDARPNPAYLVLADLAAGWFENPTLLRGAVVIPPTDWDLDERVLSVLLETLAASPIMDTLNTAALAETLAQTNGPPARVEARSADTGGLATDYPAALRDGQRAISEHASMTSLVDCASGQQAPDESLQRALLLSGSSGLTEVQRDEYLSTVAVALDTAVAGVAAPEPQRITITSRSDSIPLQLRNDLDHPVVVRVDLDSDKLELQNASFSMCLEPGANRVPVPVTVRTSGDSVLEVRISSPNGVRPVDASRLTVRATVLSGWGIGIAAGALAILLAWWARNWWKSHRQGAGQKDGQMPGQTLGQSDGQ